MTITMVDNGSASGTPIMAADKPADHWLSLARNLIPTAINKVRSANGFASRWKAVSTKLERIPACLSDLSSHPLFAKNTLCREQLHSICETINSAIELAGRCGEGKLQMQSDLDALSARLDLNLRDCTLLLKTGVLGDSDVTSAAAAARPNVHELLARLQIGHADAKHRALDGLLEAMRDDERSVLAALGRSNISALVQLLAANSLKIKEKAATVICLLTESGNCESSLISEGLLPPLIRLLESGSLVAREKAVISLQRLSMSAETARAVAGHGGIRPLVGICQIGDSITQLAATGTLKNLSAVPEVRQGLVEEGIVQVMINLLDCGVVLGSKEYAAECLQNLTSSNDNLRRCIVSEGGIRSLLNYLDGPLPQEPAVAALRNLVGSVTVDSLISLGILPRIVHVLKDGSPGAKQAAASAICKVSSSSEMKRLVGEFGCVPLLIKMLEAKTNSARESGAQALACLISCLHNSREVKKNEKSVPNLVQLLDPSPNNTAKKYAVSCLLTLSSSKKCKKLMIAHGAIGYLKKLSEMDVPGAKKLLERLERGRLKSLFTRK